MRTPPATIERLFGRLTSARERSFPVAGKAIDAPDKKGVYVIYNAQGRALHVGSTPRAKGGIAQRLRDHLAARSSFVQKHYHGDGTILRKGHTFRSIVVQDARRRALLEAYTIGCLAPLHIGHGLDGDE